MRLEEIQFHQMYTSALEAVKESDELNNFLDQTYTIKLILFILFRLAINK
jgi:hypothetical protein